MDTFLFFDTNALINLYDRVSRETFFYLSQQSLIEIEKIKNDAHKDAETRYKARKVAHLLDESENYKVIRLTREIYAQLDNFYLEPSPDNLIMACAYGLAKEKDIVLVTDDINMKFIAKTVFELKVKGINDLDLVKLDTVYKGYRTIEGGTNYINDYMSSLPAMCTNEYLIIHNTDDNTYKEMRWDGNGLVPLKLPPSKFIKGKNSLQRCALDILANPNIEIAAILGSVGGGKTFLSMQMALYNVVEKGKQAKIIGIRNPMGEGTQIGYLPGEMESKTQGFFKPLEQQLDGGEFELNRMLQNGILETNIPFYLKGCTYNEAILLVDEAEDLPDKEIKLIGTRLGQNSRVFFVGDHKQAIKNANESNGILRMCDEFKGNPKFACIFLDEDVRSNASKMFADLFI